MTDPTRHDTTLGNDTMSTSKNDHSREVQDRLEKINELRISGVNPYKDRYEISCFVSSLLNIPVESLPKADELVQNIKPIHAIAGRIMITRTHGKLSFATLRDQTGTVQICFMQTLLGADLYKFALRHIDRADFIGVKGDMFVTNHGEPTLLVTEFELLSKTMRPLPEKWHGLSDQETKYRKRFLDTLSDQSTFDRFLLRSKLIQVVRDFLLSHNFLEIETPILASSASGALAKPFTTHHNALDQDFYLRIAPETALKKAVAGGFDRVFEFAKCFRNEGIDPTHLQEFTMLEYYASFWNYEDNMNFTEQLMEHLTKELFGSTIVEFAGKQFDFKAPYPRVSMRELILKDSGIDIENHPTVESLREAISQKNIKLDNVDTLGRGNLIDTLYKKVSRPNLVGPMFLIHHPTDLSPLARRNDQNPNITDRFQLVVNSWEIVNAYSELVDPIDQRARFVEQSLAREGGDDEAMMIDDSFMDAMEHGMPPMSGWGMGIDRILSILTDQDNLKDVVLFPLMRPEKSEQTAMSSPAQSSDNMTILSTSKAVSNASETVDIKPGFTRDQLLTQIDKYVDKQLQPHLFFVEAAMKSLADFYGFTAQRELWGLAGLAHDIDWSVTEPKHNAGDELAHCGPDLDTILAEINATPEFVTTIRSHYHILNLPLDSHLKKALYAVDELCGFIVAVTYVRPSKKMADVEVSSIKKKFKDKAFAAKVDRSLILTCEQNLGTPLDKFIEITLRAMQEIAADYGL